MYEESKRQMPRAEMGEIDLFELCGNLWKEKGLIAAFTILGAVLAIAYALLATPIYKTEATVIPPRQSDIAAFNLGRLSVQAGLIEYTTDQVYAVFKRNLFSASLRNTFFEQHYLPYLGIDAAQGEAVARDGLLRSFDQILTVSQPDQRGRPDFYEVAVELEDPKLAAAWANQYVDLAAESATQEMAENVSSEISNRSRVAEAGISGLRALAQQQRQDHIARLREALGIASTLGIEDPQVTVGRSFADSELAAFVEGDLMYMRGTRALQAELQMLESRENDDPFIPQLRDLESQLAMLRDISVDKEAVAVFTLDGTAEVPETPIKPKKPLIAVLGTLLGGMLGVGIALLRIALRDRNGSAAK
ncbi:LPS O-antigen chain length determinant protein WzzB [Pseudomonas saliphila]|uniref:LPS O-antigen chain length determinant protein WzzB n=1 Tax=Pseudomonas saliphila TaxID=2586906 RepID=UPI0015B45E70|nr:Wzz/FepE/Etk N-terminal domain-containing protein [Pseudomonas saliphila]